MFEKILKVAAGAAMGALFVTAVSAQELRIGTASQGGAFYPVGQAISSLVDKYADGLTMVPVVTQGSVQNPRLVNTGEVDIAITNNNLSVLANKGVGPYKKSGAMNLRAIGSLHFSVLHMMTLDGSDINGIADLKGKRVAVGPAGGGTIPFTNQVLGLYGLSMDDITPSFLSYSDGFSQLADGNVDAAATETLRAERVAARGEDIPTFNFGGDVEQLRATCEEQTRLPAPEKPVFR